MSTSPIEPDAPIEAADVAEPVKDVAGAVDVTDAAPIEMAEAEPPPITPQARAIARRRIKADQRGVMTAAVLMATGGWLGLYVMIFPLNAVPLALYRWLFFILLNIAITGTALPFIWYLNNRFSGGRPVLGGTLLREGMWCGLFCITLAWLQMIRAFNAALALFLALIFITIEIFLRIHERQNLPI